MRGAGMRRRGWWRREVGAVVLALLAGPAGAAAPEQRDLVIGLTAASSYTAVWTAADKGIFARHGLEARFVPLRGGSEALVGLVAGSLTFATPTAPLLLQAVDAGLDVAIAAPVVTYPAPGPLGVLVAPGSPVREARDLVGRRLGVPGLGGLPHTVARKWLLESGVDPARVIVVEVPFAAMPDALRAHQVDALVGIEPFYQRVVAQGVGVPLVDLQRIMPAGTPASVYAASREWLAGHPATLAAFRESLREAIALLRDDAALTRAEIAAHLNLPAEVAAQLSVPALAESMTPQQMVWWIDLCRELGMVRGEIDPARVVWP